MILFHLREYSLECLIFAINVKIQSINLIKSNELKFKDTSWDFQKAFTKYSNHDFHTYPAMLIPQFRYNLDTKPLLEKTTATTGIYGGFSNFADETFIKWYKRFIKC